MDEERKLALLVKIAHAFNEAHLTWALGASGFLYLQGIAPSFHGGGEGKCPVGRDAPRTPWGKKARGVKTRRFKKNSTRLIMRRKNDK